ncbi:transposase-like protein [Dysgonomonas sp. PH5-45]|uniref:IS1/IS1595 family N-terminal zinc-binding domain-containing protein n=1 Tax=unclassified Dysgonomonas TaxID=2630389 RepID=UPI002474672F|nr:MULTISPECIES: hypothetical protein [unclassified Dysgonomonas]MDH6355373.1 transposase-like protein [Dysgonomonas sp. PH5-45]MDH6388271.1 transposase-like protein [Dysgonomonas sp. PH5-37]
MKKSVICVYCQKSISCVKNGVIKGKQRYRCQECKKNFYVDITIAKIDKRRYAIILYLEGLDYSKIAKILNSDRLTVERWIEKYGGENLKLIRNHRPVDSENIEGIYMARRDYNPEKSKYKLQPFRKGLSIIERESKTHFQVLDGELTKTEDYIITIKDR